MSMVRNITSHSQRAVLTERGEYSNSLSSHASQAAFLISILSEGDVDLTSMPALVDNAREFENEIRELSSRFRKRSEQSYRNLIPVKSMAAAWELNPAEAVERAEELASRLGHAIDAAQSGGKASEDYVELARELDDVADKLAAQARTVVLATIGA